MDRVQVRDAETGETLEFVVPLESVQSNNAAVKACSLSSPLQYHHQLAPQRRLGDPVGWTEQQQAKAERAQLRYRHSIPGIQHEIASATESNNKRKLEMELLDKMKANYYTQVRRLVAEETQREIAREVQLRLESNTMGRSRLEKRFEREREFYRSQIERVRAECEMALTAAMAARNFLR